MKKATFYFTVFAIITSLIMMIFFIQKYGIKSDETLLMIAVELSFLSLLSTFIDWIKRSIREYRSMKQLFENLRKEPEEIPAELKSLPIIRHCKESLLADYADYLRVDLLFHYKAPEELIEKLKI